MPVTRDLVTVVIPVYNGERFLGEAIESVLDQDYEPVEIVVVDDGSTDGSSEVAARYDEVTLIRQENQGQAVARNVAIEAGSGEFVALLDADDQMAPGRLSTQISALKDNPAAGGVLGRQRVFVEQGASPMAWMSDPRAALDVEGADAMEAEVSGVTPFYPPPTLTVRRSVFDQLGYFDPAFRMGEDVDFILRFQDAGIALETRDDLVLYRRVHGSNLTYDAAGIRESIARAFKNRIDRHRAAAASAAAPEEPADPLA
jgi:glycosyltransferase involved in cell wall biosynthesis